MSITPSISFSPHPEAAASAAATEAWLYSTLKSCPKTCLQPLHAVAVKMGALAGSPRLQRQFLALSPTPHYALQLLLQYPPDDDDPFPFNAIISALSGAGDHRSALETYALMRSLSVPPDPFTLPPVLKSGLQATDAHTIALKSGLLANPFVLTALLRSYCALGRPHLARRLFDRTPARHRDLVCWNTMLAGHANSGDLAQARQLFHQMPRRNTSSFNTMLHLHCTAGDVPAARDLFDQMPHRDLISWNAIISGYANTGDCTSAWELFYRMPNRDVVSWNVMIGCCSQNKLFHQALNLFRRMLQDDDVRPNEVTLVAVLPVCAHLGALDLGQWVHSYLRRHGIKTDIYVTTALVDMYGRCGVLEDARGVFDAAIHKDAFLYSTMIQLLAMHGKAREAFEVFDSMKQQGVEPNDITFVGLLKACGHVGLVETGWKYFKMMKNVFCLAPKAEHFGCMVDLLGRAGRLEEAHQLILGMPMHPPPNLWVSLLSSCRIHGDVELAERVGARLLELEPQGCGNYVLLSNVYSRAGRWEDAAKMRRLMKEKGVVKKPGCSAIEVSNAVYEFFAGDRGHPRCVEIYKMLDQMDARLRREEGYVACTGSALQDADRNGKEQALIHHSEKLALAFGLISTQKGSAIRIVKNLRVCDDCHLFMKLASKVYARQLILRDCHRFHHFSNGSCSCSDYW